MGQTYRIEKGSELTYQEGDDNLRYPHVWNLTKTYKTGMTVFDGSDFYYLCIQDVIAPNTIPLNNTLYWKKLTVIPALNLNDLVDVDDSSAINGSTLKFNGSSWIVDNSAIIVSHSTLSTLIANGDIIEGAWYKMEYQNKHIIPGTSSVFTGVIETLLILGIAPNKVSQQVFSVDYPQDLIFYDIDDTLCTDGITTRPGYIFSRKDVVKNVSFPFDFRNTKSRRFKQNNAAWAAATSYSLNDVRVNSGKLYGCKKAHTSSVSFSSDLVDNWIELVNFSSNPWGEYIVPGSIASLPGFLLGGFSISYDITQFQDYSILESPGDTFDVEVEPGVINVTGDLLFSRCSGIKISKSCAGITIGYENNNIDISNSASCLYFGSNVSDIQIRYSVNQVGFGDYSRNNECGVGCYKIFYAPYCINNKILSFCNDVALDRQNESNTLIRCTFIKTGQINKNLKISSTTQPFYLGQSCEDIVIENSSNVILGTSCTNCRIVDSTDVEFGNSCDNNIVERSTVIDILAGGDLVTIKDCSAVSLSINAKNVTILNNTGTLILPPSITGTLFEGCANWTYSGLPVITNCVFKQSTSILLSSANLIECRFLAKLQNKTISANLTNVTTLASSTSTDTLNSVLTDLVFDMKSPNGKIWANTISNGGTITTQSLT